MLWAYGTIHSYCTECCGTIHSYCTECCGTIHSYCTECCGRMALTRWPKYPFLLFEYCGRMALSIPTVWILWAYGTIHSFCSECCGRMALSIPTVLNVVGVWHYPFLLFWMLWAYGTIHSYCFECCGRMTLSIPTVLNAVGVWHYPFLLFWMLWVYGTNTADQSVHSVTSDKESCGCVGYRFPPPPPLPQTPIGQVAGPSVVDMILWLTDILPLSHVLISTVTRWAFLLPILHGLLPRTLLNVLLFWCCKSLLSQRQLSVLFPKTSVGAVPKTAIGAHSEHRFPAPSSKLCQIWLRHWRGTLYLRAAVHRRGQRPPKGLGTNIYD